MTTLEKLAAALALCIGLATANSAAALQATSVVKIDSGPLRGEDDGDMLSYLGIPYAAPPVGELRWRPPQAPLTWTETLEATKAGSSCVQNADLGAFATPGGSEDCLYLNVYAPRSAVQSGNKLPVFVWIHGGSLWVGQGDDYDPRKLVLDGKAIVVTLNYRLGMFGFFSHPAIDAEGHGFANYGQMDQSFSLDWVQRNIAAFGGDPNNVTIAGESSGGTSVLAQVISPWSKGKFQQAINMSGSSLIIRYPNFGAARPLDVARKVGADFATAAGCSDQKPACLRALTVGQILAIQAPYMINQTIVDGDFMPEHPAEALKSGRFNHVTLINGTTRDEGTFFAGFPENETGIAMTEADYSKKLEDFFGVSIAPRVAEQYPLDSYNSPSEAYAAAATSYLFSCPALKVNEWASRSVPVYAYEFADRTAPSYLKPTTFPLGAAHTYELPYLFPGFHGGKSGLPVSLNTLQEQLSDQMVAHWTSVSTAEKWTDWVRYVPAQQNVYRLKLPSSQILPMGRFSNDHHCDFWDRAGIY